MTYAQKQKAYKIFCPQVHLVTAIPCIKLQCFILIIIYIIYINGK